MSQSNRSGGPYNLNDKIGYEGHRRHPGSRPQSEHLRHLHQHRTQISGGSRTTCQLFSPQTKVQIISRAEVRYRLSGVGIGIEFIDLKRDQEQSINLELSGRNEMLEELDSVGLRSCAESPRRLPNRIAPARQLPEMGQKTAQLGQLITNPEKPEENCKPGRYAEKGY